MTARGVSNTRPQPSENSVSPQKATRVFLEMIGDVAERMPGGFDDFRSSDPTLSRVPFLHLMIEERDPRRVLRRTPNLRVREFCPHVRNALNVIGVMMGDQDVG